MIRLEMCDSLSYEDNIENAIRIAKKLDESVCFCIQNSIGTYDKKVIGVETTLESVLDADRKLAKARSEFKYGI